MAHSARAPGSRAAPGAAAARAVGAVTALLGAAAGVALATHNGPGPSAPQRLAEALLGCVGLVAFAWAALLLVVGILMVLGVVSWPRPKHLGALAALTLVLAALSHRYLPPAAPNGAGGVLGEALATGLADAVGPGGSVALLLLTAGSLLLLCDAGAAQRAARLVGLQPARARLRDVPGAAGVDARGADTPSPDDRAGAGAPGPDLDFSSAVAAHPRPDPSLFRAGDLAERRAPAPAPVLEALDAELRALQIEGRIYEIVEGPVVTTVRYEPAPGTAEPRVAEVARRLAPGIEIRAAPPGPAAPRGGSLEFVLPATERRIIRFGNLLRDFRGLSAGAALPIVMGVDTSGRTLVEDLARLAHLLIAGAAGSGKTVFLESIIASLVLTQPAARLRLLVIDAKGELAACDGLPHLACPVVTDTRDGARCAIEGILGELQERLRRLRQLPQGAAPREPGGTGAGQGAGSTGCAPQSPGGWALSPRIAVVIDGLDRLLRPADEAAARTGAALRRLVRDAAGAGIHLVLATREVDETLAGTLGARFGALVALRLGSPAESVAFLGCPGAESLLGKGDMLLRRGPAIIRLHGPFIEDVEVADLVRSCAA
jgi:hypothetical protein